MEEEDKSEDGGGGGSESERPATDVDRPCIIATCQNVHSNNPYHVWKPVLQKIFNLPVEVISPRAPLETPPRAS